MHWITSTFMILLCTFFKARSFLFYGKTNATSPSNAHSDPDVYNQLLHLEKVLESILRDQQQQALKNQQFLHHQKLLEEENHTAQMKISFLESENKILKKRLDNLNSTIISQDEKLSNLTSTSTFLLQENLILKDQIQILNSTSMLIQQNLTTSEDLKMLENILTFEIGQLVRDSENKMMKNMSATVQGLEVRDRYLSLSLLDVHNNLTLLNITLSKLNQHQKTREEKQNKTIQQLSLSLRDLQNNTAGLSFSLYNLDTQQKLKQSEIQTLTNSQQHDISKLNDTIIHLKNRAQSNVAFTAGILGEINGQHTYRGTVIFPKVIYQVGGGYNPTTGVFTAPKAGLYILFCTNVAFYDESFWTKIMVNGSVKAGAMAYVSGSANTYQSASNLVVHQLQVGDRVWIEISSGTHLYSSFPDTTFSVIMINGSD